MSLRISYDSEMDWIVFEAEAKGFIYRQVMLSAMLEQCSDPAQAVVSLVSTMRRVLQANER